MFQIGLRAEVRIEKAVAIPARRETGPPDRGLVGYRSSQITCASIIPPEGPSPDGPGMFHVSDWIAGRGAH